MGTTVFGSLPGVDPNEKSGSAMAWPARASRQATARLARTAPLDAKSDVRNTRWRIESRDEFMRALEVGPDRQRRTCFGFRRNHAQSRAGRKSRASHRTAIARVQTPFTACRRHVFVACPGRHDGDG